MNPPKIETQVEQNRKDIIYLRNDLTELRTLHARTEEINKNIALTLEKVEKSIESFFEKIEEKLENHALNFVTKDYLSALTSEGKYQKLVWSVIGATGGSVLTAIILAVFANV